MIGTKPLKKIKEERPNIFDKIAKEQITAVLKPLPAPPIERKKTFFGLW